MRHEGEARSIFQPKALTFYLQERMMIDLAPTATIVDKSHLYSGAASSLLSFCALMAWSMCVGQSSSRRSLLFISSFYPRLLSSRARGDLSSLFIPYSTATGRGDRWLVFTRPTIHCARVRNRLIVLAS